jgi:hypothetical protein
VAIDASLTGSGLLVSHRVHRWWLAVAVPDVMRALTAGLPREPSVTGTNSSHPEATTDAAHGLHMELAALGRLHLRHIGSAPAVPAAAGAAGGGAGGAGAGAGGYEAIHIDQPYASVVGLLSDWSVSRMGGAGIDAGPPLAAGGMAAPSPHMPQGLLDKIAAIAATSPPMVDAVAPSPETRDAAARSTLLAPAVRAQPLVGPAQTLPVGALDQHAVARQLLHDTSVGGGVEAPTPAAPAGAWAYFDQHAQGHHLLFSIVGGSVARLGNEDRLHRDCSAHPFNPAICSGEGAPGEDAFAASGLACPSLGERGLAAEPHANRLAIARILRLFGCFCYHVRRAKMSWPAVRAGGVAEMASAAQWAGTLARWPQVVRRFFLQRQLTNRARLVACDASAAAGAANGGHQLIAVHQSAGLPHGWYLRTQHGLGHYVFPAPRRPLQPVRIPVPPQLDPLVAWVLLLGRECRTLSVADANVPIVHAGAGELALPLAAAISGRPMLPSRVLLVSQARQARAAQPPGDSIAMKNAAVRAHLSADPQARARLDADGLVVITTGPGLPAHAPTHLPRRRLGFVAAPNMQAGLPTGAAQHGSADAVLLAYMITHDPASLQWPELAVLTAEAAGQQPLPSCACAFCHGSSAGSCPLHTPNPCPPRTAAGYDGRCDAARMSRACILHAAANSRYIASGLVADLVTVVPSAL